MLGTSILRKPIVWKSFLVALLTALFLFGVREIPKHPHGFGVFQFAFSFLPGLTGYFFAMAGVALLFMQDDLKKLDEHRMIRLLIAAFIFLIGLGAVVSDSTQKSQDKKEAQTERDIAKKERDNAKTEREQLTKQVLTLISSAQVQATKDDIKGLGITIDKGFGRVVSAIEGRPAKATDQPAPAPPAVPTIENTRLVQRSAPSSDPKLPYGLQIILQSNVTIDPVAFAFECSGEVGKVDFFIAGQSAYMSVQSGPADQNKKIAIVRFTFPSLKPETPLVITILSEKEIHVLRAFKLNP